MANNIFKPYQILSSQLNTLPIISGQFIFTTDTNLLYIDISDSQRISVSVPAATTDSIGGVKVGEGLDIDENGALINSEEDPVFSYSAAATISDSDISAWNSKQNALVSGTTLKTINQQSLLGAGDINTIYTAGEGISIANNVIKNKITSYNDLTDLPFIPTSLEDLGGTSEGYAKVNVNNNFTTSQTIKGDVNVTNELHTDKTLSVVAFGIYQEADGSYTFGKVG